MPVQYVLRPHTDEYHDYRGYAGRVAGGVFKPGDEVVVLPSGFTSRIKAIDTHGGPVDEAFSPMSVTILLEDEIDISRGDMIARPGNQPHVGQDIDAMVCWLTEASSLSPRVKLGIKHTTRFARALVKDIQYRLDVNTLHRDEQANGLALNEIGRVTPADHPAAVLRRVPAQPRDRFVHPDRRVHEQHRRRRHDRRIAVLTVRSSA